MSHMSLYPALTGILGLASVAWLMCDVDYRTVWQDDH